MAGTSSQGDSAGKLPSEEAILSAIEQLRISVLARLDRLEAILVSNPDLSPPAEITAHVQNVGDVEGGFGDWIGERRSGRWIEGLKITASHGIGPEELRYRVVLGRDRLSPWTYSGRFCGSQGFAQPLLGFCIALHGQAVANYECSYGATFIDGSVIESAPSGQTCVAATFAPLEALRIDLRPRGRRWRDRPHHTARCPVAHDFGAKSVYRSLDAFVGLPDDEGHEA